MDIRIPVSFRGHRKRKRLRSVLGPGSTDYLIDLWLSTAMNKPKGILYGMDAIDIAIEAGWDGDAEFFVSSLIDTGFLEQNEDGVYVLHDWEIHQGFVFYAEERRTVAKNAANSKTNQTREFRKEDYHVDPQYDGRGKEF